MLSLAIAASLCGYRNYTAMAGWGRTYGATICQALGFTRATPPCAATFSLLFRRLHWAALDACLGSWALEVLQAQGGTEATLPGMAIDGKTLRGSRKQGLTLGQGAVAETTNEMGAVHDMLRGLLEGWVVSMDALPIQQKVAQTIVAAGGDYVMVVKENQPGLHEAIATALADPGLLAGCSTTARTTNRGHGRLEERQVTLTSALAAYLSWPGQHQVFALTRTITSLRTGEQSVETVYGITSLGPERIDAAGILRYVWGHCGNENRSHYVRHATFAEDHSLVHVGVTHQVLARLRYAAIGLLCAHGESNIASACRRLAVHPWHALALIGIPCPEN